MRSSKRRPRNAKHISLYKKGGAPTHIEINSVYLAHRILLIASIESNNALNKDINYTPNYVLGTYTKESVNYPVKQSFAFEYSSGSSNLGENFPTTFLPIMFIDSVGRYINKASNLGEEIIDYIIQMILPYIVEQCKNNASDHLTYFLKRFGCWKQVQISAAIGGETWDTYAHFNLLRSFAFTYDYIHNIEGFSFVERINPIQPVDLTSLVPIVDGTTMPLFEILLNYSNDGILINNVEINSWLHHYMVISSEKLLQLSQPLSDEKPVKEKDIIDYKKELFQSSLENFFGKIVQFPPELMDSYINKKDYINKTRNNIAFNKLNQLFNDVEFANNNNAKFYETYRKEVDSVTDPELRKYFPFLLFRRDEIMYEGKGITMSANNLIKALKSIQRKYPEFEVNKFNWRICS